MHLGTLPLVAACPSIFKSFLFWTENGIFSSPSPFVLVAACPSIFNIFLVLDRERDLLFFVSFWFPSRLKLHDLPLQHYPLVVHKVLSPTSRRWLEAFPSPFEFRLAAPFAADPGKMFLRSWHGNVCPCFSAQHGVVPFHSIWSNSLLLSFFFELCPAVWVHAKGVHFFSLLELLLAQTLQHVVTRNFCTLVSGTSSHFVSRLCVLPLFNVTLIRSLMSRKASSVPLSLRLSLMM